MTDTRYTVPMEPPTMFERVRECVRLLQQHGPGYAPRLLRPHGFTRDEIATALSCLPFCEVVK